jgi:DNA-binding LacI/PurR family transcriptional regulator
MMTLAQPPTAIFITDPLTASGAMIEAHKMGLRIPDELSVLGFDDTETRYVVHPTMSAICQDSWDLGRSAYELLLRLCAMPADKRAATVPPSVLGKAWLEINHTTGRAPAGAIRVLPSGQRLGTART